MRIWKKLAAIVLALSMVLTVACAVGESQRDDAATSGIDVVIVLDMTNSMSGGADKKLTMNDPNNYRLDAAAMLIGMMDMDGSRAAIVPFALNPFKVTELTDLTEYTGRSKLLNSIYEAGKTTRAYTNIGEALMTANKILMDREDKTNRPMIVLLTDGSNQVEKGQEIENSLRWDGTNIVAKGKVQYETDVANDITREAVDCAKTLGIPIYTIALSADPDASENGAMTLRAISQSTGVTDGCWAVSADNAATLPEFFARVLAEEIGSSVQYTAKPKYVKDIDKETKQYSVQIPILNQSVLETNIILPVNDGTKRLTGKSGIDGKSIRITDSTGTVQNEISGTTVLSNTNSHFAMVKIREPKATGMWTLTFNSTKDPSAISFNILYNYNIKLEAQLEKSGADQTFYKSDKLRLTSQFVDLDGAKSLDSALYQDHTGEEGYEPWMTIDAGWKLMGIDPNGNLYTTPLLEGKMQCDPVRQVFTGEVDLAGKGLLSGNYVLAVTANGAGLSRLVNIPVTFADHLPTAEEYSSRFQVNSTVPGQENSWTVEGTAFALNLRADEIVSDKDGDQLEFSLVPDDPDETIMTLSLNPDNTITVTPKLDKNPSADGRNKVASGTATFTLHYDDKDSPEGRGSVKLTITAISGVDQMLAAYTPETTLTGANSNGDYPKNTPVTVTVRLKDTAGGYAESSQMEGVSGSVTVLDTVSGEYVCREAPMTMGDGRLEFTVPSTGNKAAAWQMTVAIPPFADQNFTLNIPNTSAPTAKADTVTIYGGNTRIPGFLRSLASSPDTAEDDPARVIDGSAIFTDPDNDTLTFTEPKFLDKDGNDITGTFITAVPTGEGTWRIDTTGIKQSVVDSAKSTFSSSDTSGKAMLTITATDGDGETTSYTREIKVVDVWKQLMWRIVIVLAAAIVLIIVIRIVIQIMKPKFGRLAVIVREEPSMYDNPPTMIPSTKKKVTLTKVGVDGAMADSHGPNMMEQVQNIILAPVHGTGSVKLILKKLMRGVNVTLDGRSLKQGSTRWNQGGELEIRADSGTGSVIVRLVSGNDAEDDTAGDIMGDEGDWGAADFESAHTSSRIGKKANRTASKKQSTQSSTPTNTDDFDF